MRQKALTSPLFDNSTFAKNFAEKNLSNYFLSPQQHDFVDTTWLAYPLILSDNLNKTRTDLQIYLEKYNRRRILNGGERDQEPD